MWVTKKDLLVSRDGLEREFQKALHRQTIVICAAMLVLFLMESF